jgi:ubiquinone/menaquinone biosynthesis C-methylase UbiE
VGIYENRILPWLIDAGCGTSPIMKQRAKVVPQASGTVLEVGMGPGHNLALYDPSRVDLVWGLEPAQGMRRRAERNLATSPVPVRWLDLPGERVPLDDGSVDTVVLTFTLCTIADWVAALAQMHRVLKPGGQMLFCEHGLAPDPGIQAWQNRINPTWKRVCGGCNLNRDIPAMLRAGGFEPHRLEAAYLPGTPRIAGFNYWGEALRVD